MIQAIGEPTREENEKKSTLDLVYTNDIDLFTEIGVYKSCMSDHHTLEISTSYEPKIEKRSHEELYRNINILRELNFYSEDIQWKEVNKRIKEIPWEEVQENKSMEELNEYLIIQIIRICRELIPKKSDTRKDAQRKIPRARRKLLGRMKMLKRGKRKAVSNSKKDEIDKKIQEVEKQLIDERMKERLRNEKKIVERIQKNPKVLYSYVKKENGRKNEIGPLREGDKYIYNNEEICKLMVNQYKSQFSKPRTNLNDEEINTQSDNNSDELTDINITEEDIQNAIKEMNENSSAGPDDIPALFLIKTKETISTPLKFILRKSLDEGVIPEIYLIWQT